jgi:hypothetical protein
MRTHRPIFLRRERKLPQRNHQPVEVGGDDQSRLAARQRQHRAVLVGEDDRARSGADRDTPAGSAIDAINIGRPSDVADRADKIGRCGASNVRFWPLADMRCCGCMSSAFGDKADMVRIGIVWTNVRFRG